MGSGHVSRSPDPEDTELASDKTVRQYRGLRSAHNTAAIARLIHQRFSERYFVPTVWSDYPHGFTIMAVSCLMVESIESFRLGLPDSERQSERMFCGFFQREAEFVPFRPVAHEFYKHVRCGILHQGETTGRWRVQLQGPLLEELNGTRWVNALEFALCVHRALQAYCSQLEATPETESVWIEAFKKLRAICKHCGVTNLNGL